MSTTLDTLQALDVPALTLAALALTAVGLVVSDPVLGRRDHRALLADVAADPAGGEGPRVRFFRRWTRGSWAWAVAVVLLVAALPGVGLGSLGLRAPDLAGLGTRAADGAPAGSASAGDALATGAGLLVGAVLALLAGVVLVRVLARVTSRVSTRSAATAARTDRTLPLAGAAALTPMLPTTPRGRRGWAALSVAAGVTEEVTYRGLLVLTLALVLPGADPRVVVAAAAVLFGVAHTYQGWTGMLATGVVGAALTGLYLATGSLLVPMVLHVLLDLRVLLLAPGTRRAGPDAAARTADPARA